MVAVDLVRRHVLDFELEIYHILMVLLQAAGSRFMERAQSGGDAVRALCSGLMQFSSLWTGCPLGTGSDLQDALLFL